MSSDFPGSADYLAALARFPRYLANAWCDLGDGRGYFGDPSHLEGGIRAMGNIVYVAALLASESEAEHLLIPPHPDPLPEGEGMEKGSPAIDGEGARGRAWLLEKARAGLAYMTRGHVTGDKACGDGQRWGGVWQSAWWTTRMALGAKLIWAELSDAERAEVERVVVFEADLQLPRIVPSGLAEDTKAEENAWDTEILATAISLFPEHPHREQWWAKLLEFAYNTFSIAADRQDERITDGRPLKDWVYTVNLYSDFTLENHGAWHFCYVASPLHSLAWASYALLAAGIEPPEALYHHAADVWRQAKPTFLRDRFAYVGGQDWARYTYGQYFIVPALVWLNRRLGDPETAAIEAARFRCLREEQAENEDGSFFGKRFTRPHYYGQPEKYETDCYANLGLAYQLSVLFRPVLLPLPPGEGGGEGKKNGFLSAGSDIAAVLQEGINPEFGSPHPSPLPEGEGRKGSDALSQLSGRLVSPESGVAYVRTPDLFASFSWKTLTEPYPIGLFVPVGREELAEWQPGNLFGRVVPWGENPSAVWVRRMKEEGAGFRIAGTVIYRGKGGAILYTQELEFAVDPVAGTAEVRSRFVAVRKFRVRRVEGLRLAIANDRWNGGRLDLFSEAGRKELRFDPDARPWPRRMSGLPGRIVRKILRETLRDGRRRPLPGRWVNVDGAYGVIARGAQPLPFTLYQPHGRNLPDGSLHFELLFCPLRFENRHFEAGEEILNTEFTLVLGDADATRKLAENLP